VTWTVRVEPKSGDGAVSRFTVRVDGHSYDVGLSRDEAATLAPGAGPEDLVRESFRFLLEREPPASILRRFDLPVIGRYFPEYGEEIRRRLGR
jgi:hypothetical protein